ncbi:MAG: hypothetical protein Q9184_006585 [Pyrenodesmia sp. 2 TL-2023]
MASAADTIPPPSQNSDTQLLCGDSSIQTPMAEPSQAPVGGHPDPLIGRSATQQNKKERVLARRREATLKRKAEMIATCECKSECQCRSGSVHSNAASYGQGGSDRSIQVPEHVLQHVLNESSGSWTSQSSSSLAIGSSLTGIDGHVHFDVRNASLDDPENPVLETRSSFDDRLSQASTACIRSNGSSISLVSRRASPLRRSNTAPGFPMRHNAHALRPSVHEALQNPYIPDQVYNTATEVQDSPNSRGRNPGDTSEQVLDVSEESPADPEGPRV